jgi:hypothetical protein
MLGPHLQPASILGIQLATWSGVLLLVSAIQQQQQQQQQ